MRHETDLSIVRNLELGDGRGEEWLFGRAVVWNERAVCLTNRAGTQGLMEVGPASLPPWVVGRFARGFAMPRSAMKTDHLTAILTCVVLATAVVSLPASAQTVNNAQVVGIDHSDDDDPGLLVQRVRHDEEYRDHDLDQGYGLQTGSGRRLGPLRADRIDLADADSIAPSQDHAFSFTMLAPSTGIYTTDWRMLRENVEWFGDTLTGQVNVSFGRRLPTPDHHLANLRHDPRVKPARHPVSGRSV